MPILIKSIQGVLLDNFVTNVSLITSLSASVQDEDYINLNGFIAYLQNFKKANYVEDIDKPLTFGLKNQYNLPTITLEISY